MYVLMWDDNGVWRDYGDVEYGSADEIRAALRDARQREWLRPHPVTVRMVRRLISDTFITEGF